MTNLKGQNPICGLLQVPAAVFLWFPCENLQFSAKICVSQMLCFQGKGENLQTSAQICENLYLGAVCPLKCVPSNLSPQKRPDFRAISGIWGVKGLVPDPCLPRPSNPWFLFKAWQGPMRSQVALPETPFTDCKASICYRVKPSATSKRTALGIASGGFQEGQEVLQ